MGNPLYIENENLFVNSKDEKAAKNGKNTMSLCPKMPPNLRKISE